MFIKNESSNKLEHITEATTSKQSTETISSFPFYSSPSVSTFIYVTDIEDDFKTTEAPLKSDNSELYSAEIYDELNANFPLFFQNIDTIFIPKKAKRYLERAVPKKYLKDIDSNIDTAIEKCLVWVSNLSSTVYSDNRWKELSSTIMDIQTKKGNDNTRIYPQIIKVLKYSTNTTEGIILVKKNSMGKETYQEGVACKSYALTNTYYETGLVKYVIKDKEILQKRKSLFFSQLNKAQDNIIARNLIALYSKIELPNYNEIELKAKQLVKDKYKTKKRKTLTFLNKHPKSYFKDASSRSFVEDNIKLFKYLTKDSFMIPIIGDEKSGGRVVDSFTLLSNWIRSQVKIDEEYVVEVDFRALHPNIAMLIYGGSRKYLTHNLVAQESNIDLKDVKTEHLSFFNETLWGMKKNKLYDYYKSSEPQMLKNIEQDKYNSAKKHKITSVKMFAKEVEIMTECIKQLNDKGIYVGYVYDALFCKNSDAEIVKEVMNKVVLDCNVFTSASIN